MSNQHYQTAIAKLFGPKEGLGQDEISSLFVDHAVFRFLYEVRRGSNRIQPFIFGWIWNQYVLLDDPAPPSSRDREFFFYIRYKTQGANVKCSMLFDEAGKIEALWCGEL